MQKKVKIKNIKDIARLAGVSVGSASMALNDTWHKKVKAEVVERVKKVAADHNYTINRLGKALHMRKYFRVGLLIESSFKDTPIIGGYSFHDFIANISDELHHHGYALNIVSVDKKMQADIIVSGQYPPDNDAMIFLEWSPKVIKKILVKSPPALPYMNIGDNLRNTKLCYCHRDFYTRTYEAITYFIKGGHKQIAFLRSYGSAERFELKLKAYKAALKDNGMEFRPELLIYNPEVIGLQEGYIAGQLLMNMKPSPTAFFCDDNMAAIGLIWVLDKMGIKIPDDVELIGYGDKDLASISIVPMSYIQIPTPDVASFCIEQILSWCNKKEDFKPIQKVFTEKMIWGGTTRTTGNDQ